MKTISEAAVLSLTLSLFMTIQAQTTPATLGPYSAPHKPGVPNWVYNTRVSPELRTRFEVLYEMLNQRLAYQGGTTAENIEKLAERLNDVASGGDIPALDAPPGSVTPLTVPSWVWHLDDAEQIKWFQNRIRQNVNDFHLNDIALSEDLIPSLRPDPNYRPTTIGPTPQASRPLSSDGVIKLLAPAAKEAAKPVDASKAATPVLTRNETLQLTIKMRSACLEQRTPCISKCGSLDNTVAIGHCYDRCNAATDACTAKADAIPIPK